MVMFKIKLFIKPLEESLFLIGINNSICLYYYDCLLRSTLVCYWHVGVVLILTKGAKTGNQETLLSLQSRAVQGTMPLCLEGLAEKSLFLIPVLGNLGGVISCKCPMVSRGGRCVSPARMAHLRFHGSFQGLECLSPVSPAFFILH